MILYLDTNVFLARYATHESHHEEAKTLLQRIEKGEMKAVTSTLTLIEVACTTSRAYDRLTGTTSPLNREEIMAAFLKRLVNTKNLDFIPLGGEVSTNIGEQDVKIPAVYAVALEVASKTALKTLDTLHIASAMIASRLYGYNINLFVTLDEGILKRYEEVMHISEMKVISPGNLDTRKRVYKK